MPTDIVMPEAGESVTSGVIAAWVKQDGDWVERDETVAEVETDKITVEVPAPASGVLKTSVAVDEEIEIGQVLGSIDESAEKPEAAGAEASKGAQEAERESAQDGAGAAEGGGRESPERERVETDGRKGGEAEEREGEKGDGQAAAASNGDVRATPLARKLAEEHNLDLSRIKGTGAGQRIREQDVRDFLESDGGGGAGAPAGQAPRPAREAPSVPAAAAEGRGVHRERLSPLRQRIAARLVEAQQTAAMLTTFNECDMSAVMALRKRYKEPFQEKHGIGLGFMSFFVKAVVQGLRTYPDVNSFITEEDGRPAIERHDYCDVAIAVSSPKGLVVPVLRDAQNLSFGEIESGIKDLATKARDGKLTLEEMQGGTFTITNGGIFGSLNSTPILNPPQSGILGMHAIKNRPVEDPDNPGQLALRPMMYLALSYDHRMIDGATAVRFLVTVKECIEDPERLLLDV